MSHEHRSPGFYWVRREEEAPLEVAELTEQAEWRFTSGDVDTYYDEGWGFYWIGERLEPPKNAR